MSRGQETDFPLVPFLLGGLVGAVLGILWAPAPGNETRRYLGDAAKDAAGRLSKRTGAGSSVYEDVRAAISTAFADGRRAYREERQRRLFRADSEDAKALHPPT